MTMTERPKMRQRCGKVTQEAEDWRRRRSLDKPSFVLPRERVKERVCSIVRERVSGHKISKNFISKSDRDFQANHRADPFDDQLGNKATALADAETRNVFALLFETQTLKTEKN